MREKPSKKQAHLFPVSAAILLVGLGIAVAIYLAADSDLDREAGYEVAGKFIYPAMNERSKKYQHDPELYGGKAAVLAMISTDGSTGYGEAARLRLLKPVFRFSGPSASSRRPGMLILTGTPMRDRMNRHERLG